MENDQAGESSGRVLATRLALGVAVAIPLLRFALDASRGLDHLHHHYLVDDAFYYFVIARHVPDFNPGIATSGFHPLYAWIAAGLHGVLPPASTIVACLGVLATANAACVFVVYHLLSRWFTAPIPLVCALGWALSTRIHTLTMSGVETALAVLAVLVCLDRFAALLGAGSPGGRSRFADPAPMAGFGVWLGVAFWARMDAPLLLAPAAGWAFVRALAARAPRAALAMSLPAVTLPLSWMAYIRYATGSAFPTSGAALRALRDSHTTLQAPLDRVIQTAQTPLRYLEAYLGELSVGAALFALGVGLAALLLWLGASRRVSRRFDGLGVYAGVVAVGFALWASYYVFYLGGFRVWYGLYLAIPLYALAWPLIAAAILERVPSRLLAVCAFSAAIAVASLSSRGGPVAPQEYDKYHAALAANVWLQRIEPGATVGSFNTGVYNFYTDVEILNLDGVVNPAAVEAHRRNDIVGYMRERNVRYLIEHDPARTSTFRQVFARRDVHFEPWVDLSRAYEPYAGRYAKRTYLWKVSYPEGSSGAAGP